MGLPRLAGEEGGDFREWQDRGAEGPCGRARRRGGVKCGKWRLGRRLGATIDDSLIMT